MHPNEHPCFFDSQCSSGFCDHLDHRCRDTIKGDRCPDSKQCHGGLKCSASTDRCGARKKTPTGGKCVSDLSCHSSEYCDAVIKHCKPSPKENEACSIGLGGIRCARGLACNGSVCLPACMTDSDCTQPAGDKKLVCRINLNVTRFTGNGTMLKGKFGYCAEPSANTNTVRSWSYSTHHGFIYPPLFYPFLFGALGFIVCAVVAGVAFRMFIKRKIRNVKTVHGTVLCTGPSNTATEEANGHTTASTAVPEKEVSKLDFSAPSSA